MKCGVSSEINVSIWTDRRPTSHRENFEWRYLRNRLSDPLHVWFYGFGDGQFNSVI